ncbi:MAG: YjjG family noncanonical pyrimidine nucleotidase [Clostridia bacterium]|nr:YjjG family noncanonical pyrimidine nucleotidase [Clostridia bacterium]
MSYTSLFLDLDNTLLDFQKAEKQAILLVLAENGLPANEETAALYSEINRSFWERFERGEIPKAAIFTGRFETLLAALHASGDVEAISKQYCQYLSDGFFTVDGAISVLTALKEKGYLLYATTNGLSATQYKRIDGSGLRPYFDGIFVSEDANAQKPQKEYFEYVIAHIPEQDRRRILIIGDSQSSDILGGINAGIDTCWYNPHALPARWKATYEIRSLLELPDLL